MELSHTIEALKQNLPAPADASAAAVPPPPEEEQPQRDDNTEQDSVTDAEPSEDADDDQLQPLSDDDDVDNEALKSTTSTYTAKTSWLIRHSGSTHLTCDIFRHGSVEPPIANECISIRDDNGYYTTYVHMDEKIRTITLKRMLSTAANIIAFKIVHVNKQPQNSRHFWKLAEGIQQKHSSLKMERINPHAKKSLFSSFMK